MHYLPVRYLLQWERSSVESLEFFYVIIAGMKEVGMVNVVNVIVMYVGLIAAAIILGHVLPGNGWSDFEAYFMSSGQEHMLNFFGAPEYFSHLR